MCEGNRTLWVGNLSPNVDEELLTELFLQAGPLHGVVLPKGPNGLSKGYAFVNFKHECSVIYAQALMTGITLFGKKITPFISGRNQNSRRSLQDHIKPQSPRFCCPTGNVNRFQGFPIPVLGSVYGPPFHGYPPTVGLNVPFPIQNPSPQCFEKQDFKKRRTMDTFQFGGPCNNFTPVSRGPKTKHSPEMFSSNVAFTNCADNAQKSKFKECTNKPRRSDSNVSYDSCQGRPRHTIYDQRRLGKKKF